MRKTRTCSQVEWLQETLGFTRQQAARVVYANPGILLSSIEGSLMPKIRWLAEALQMDEEMIFDMIRRRVQGAALRVRR